MKRQRQRARWQRWTLERSALLALALVQLAQAVVGLLWELTR